MTKPARGLIAAAVATLAIVGVANATRRVPPWGGRGDNGSFAFTCMDIDVFDGSVVSNCGGTQEFLVPLAFDNSGTKNVTFIIQAAGSADGCAAATIKRDGAGYTASSIAKPSQTGIDFQLTTGSVSVGTDNQFMADCQLTNGARLSTISFAQ